MRADIKTARELSDEMMKAAHASADRYGGHWRDYMDGRGAVMIGTLVRENLVLQEALSAFVKWFDDPPGVKDRPALADLLANARAATSRVEAGEDRLPQRNVAPPTRLAI